MLPADEADNREGLQVKTTKEKKDEFISKGSEIAQELIRIFGKDRHINIADIGANDGLSTIIYSKLFPNARFLCFEPIHENYDEMIHNFIEYGIVDRVAYKVPFALGDRRGKVKVWKSSGDAPGVEGWETGNKSSSLLKPKKHLQEHEWCRFDQSEEIDVLVLDDIETSLNVPIDYAHIDVQGAEMMVLKGGRKTFSKTTAIWIEVANVELYEGQPMKRDIQLFMESIGMKCELDTCGNRKYGDMLWRR
jgi:FkbM family methyltransferase